MRTIELLAILGTAFGLLGAAASLVRVLRGWLTSAEPPREPPGDGAAA